jgi:hypothetical protein
MSKDSDRIDIDAIAGEDGLHDVVVDVVEAAAGARSGGLKTGVQAVLGGGAEIPVMGSDPIRSSSHALRPLGRVEQCDDVHESIPIVIELTPIHPSCIDRLEDFFNECAEAKRGVPRK